MIPHLLGMGQDSEYISFNHEKIGRRNQREQRNQRKLKRRGIQSKRGIHSDGRNNSSF